MYNLCDRELYQMNETWKIKQKNYFNLWVINMLTYVTNKLKFSERKENFGQQFKKQQQQKRSHRKYISRIMLENNL